MKKISFKTVLLYTLTALLAFGLGVFALACVIRPQPLDVGEADLSAVEDGEYIGVCQNKLLFAVVKVGVREHQISHVDVLYHKASYMAQAERIAAEVCAGGSLETDAISGATLTCDTVRAAIKNALTAPAARIS